MAILEKVDKLHQATAWRGEMPLASRYTAGIAGETFFREIKDNARIVGTRCSNCDLVYVFLLYTSDAPDESSRGGIWCGAG